MSPPRPTSAGSEPALAYVGELRAELVSAAGRSVLTGGQTGVDTAAALAALRAGLPVHLVFPRGLRQEDGPITPARRRALHGAAFHELDSPEFADRTWACVSLADAVILIDPAGGDGCQETVRAAQALDRPLLRLDDPPASDEDLTDQVRSFVLRNEPRVLMIAGCRASLLAGRLEPRDLRARLAAIVAAARLS